MINTTKNPFSVLNKIEVNIEFILRTVNEEIVKMEKKNFIKTLYLKGFSYIFL